MNEVEARQVEELARTVASLQRRVDGMNRELHETKRREAIARWPVQHRIRRGFYRLTRGSDSLGYARRVGWRRWEWLDDDENQRAWVMPSRHAVAVHADGAVPPGWDINEV